MRRLSLLAVGERRVEERVAVYELGREPRGDIIGKTINQIILLLLYIIVDTLDTSTLDD